MKKRLIKVVAALFGSVAALAGIGVIYLYLAFPKVPPAPQLTIEATPQRIERGGYLFNHVAGCVDCHSERDFSQFTGPVIPGTEGKGGAPFLNEEIGIPGQLYPPNITPAGLARWSDGEILRAITEGVSRDGRPLFPAMPYPAFSQLTREDAFSIVAYLRTLKPVQNDVPKSRLNFPVNLIVRTIPRRATLAEHGPDPKDSVARGRYLITLAGCTDCHTAMENAKPVEGKEFAGGARFPFPNGSAVRSANITPDVETGIGSWSRETFVKRFKSNTPPAAAHGVNTLMPWDLYAGLTEEDLGSMYDYLRTLKPVKNRVEHYSLPGHTLAKE